MDRNLNYFHVLDSDVDDGVAGDRFQKFDCARDSSPVQMLDYGIRDDDDDDGRRVDADGILVDDGQTGIQDDHRKAID